MRITVFIDSLNGGGAERVCCNLANHLSEKNHEVTLLTMSQTEEAYPIFDNVKRVALARPEERKNKLKCNILRYFRLKKYIKKTGTDCFVVMLPTTISFLLHFRRLIKAPIIASERCNPYVYPKMTQKMVKTYAKRADAWVFQTEDAAKWYDGIVKKSIVIPNAINADFIREPYCGEREKSIVAAGRLSEQKNYKLLIDAFLRLSDDFSEYELKIFGKGPLEDSIKEYVKDKGIEHRVRFMGYVNNMPEQLEKATMFVLASDYEGMPNALMEAMALGLPCVSTDCPVGGPRFLIRNGENGLLLPVGNLDEMTEAMRKILSYPDEAKRIGENARNIAKELSPSEIYERWENVIENAKKEYDL